MKEIIELDDAIKAIKAGNGANKINLGSKNLDDNSIRLLAEALKEAKCSHDIDLYGNRISPEGARYLSEALKETKYSHKIDLMTNRLNTQSVKYLSEGLKEARCSHAIILAGNNIGPEGVKHLSECLKEAQYPHIFDLSLTQMIDESSKYLFEALKEAKCFHILDISHNEIRDDSAEALIKLLETKYFPFDWYIRVFDTRINAKNMEEIDRLLFKNSAMVFLSFVLGTINILPLDVMNIIACDVSDTLLGKDGKLVEKMIESVNRVYKERPKPIFSTPWSAGLICNLGNGGEIGHDILHTKIDSMVKTINPAYQLNSANLEFGQMIMKFDSQDAAKNFYEKFCAVNTLFPPSVVRNNEIVLYDPGQIDFFISTICKQDTKAVYEMFPDFEKEGPILQDMPSLQ